MKTIIVAFLALCVHVSISFAQPNNGVYMPGRSMAPNAPAKVYKDSAEFQKVFKELYALIGPKTSVEHDAKEYLSRMSRSFAMQGIDSAQADSVALIGLDPQAYYKMYFQAYRTELTAVELKKYLEFVKTPEGTKIIGILPLLQRVVPESNAYLSRLIITNLGPLREQARERMEKERPPSQRGKAPVPQFTPGDRPPIVPSPPGGIAPPTPPSPKH